MPTDPRKALLWLIVGTGLLRLAWAGTLEPTNDEAYHWLYTVHPALSYFDHPPMTAWVATAGLTACGGWVHPLTLRLGFVLMFAGSTWILYRWTARWFGGWAGVYAAVGLNVSAYYTAAAGAFALPDGPFLFFALLTYWQASEAISPPPPVAGGPEKTPTPQGSGELARWLLVGVGFAGALLSKYHAIFLPAGVLAFVLVTPGMRRVLRTPGPYLAVLLGGLGFLPVILWNAANDWVSFKFQGGRAVGLSFRPEGVLAWAFGPALFLLPGVWFALVREAAPRLRHFGRTAGIERLLVCLAVVPLLFFLAVSCVRLVLLHWNLIGFVPLYPLAGKTWAAWSITNPARARFGLRFMATSVLLIAALVWVHVHVGLFRPPANDPTDDIAGWDTVAAELESRGFLADQNRFLITNRWYDGGHLAFAVRGRLPVVCYNAHDARGFAFWSRPGEWVGKSAYFVLVTSLTGDGTEVEQATAELRTYFAAVTLAAEFPMTRGGKPWRAVRVFDCARQLRPFPFTDPARE